MDEGIEQSKGNVAQRRTSPYLSRGLPATIWPTKGVQTGEGTKNLKAIASVNSGLGIADKGEQRADNQACRVDGNVSQASDFG